MDLFKYHERIGYTFIPNLKVRVDHTDGPYLMRTDQLGFRNDREITNANNSIFVFGDSFTAGDGVSNGRRYTDFLQEGIKDSEIFNFGLPGSGTDQQYLTWEAYAKDLSPRLTVIAVLVENIRRNMVQHRYVVTPEGEKRLKPKPYFDFDEAGQLVLRQVPVPRDLLPLEASKNVDQGGKFPGLRKLITDLGLKENLQKFTKYQPVPGYNSANSKDWLLMRGILKNWTSQISGPCVIVPIPLYQHIEETACPKAYQTRFSEFSNETSIPVIDPLKKLQLVDVAKRRDYRLKNDTHLSTLGHKALAGAVLDEILELI